MTSRQLLNLIISRRRQTAFVLTAVIAVAGWSWFGHDTLLLAALVWAGGLLWCSRKWRAGLLATAIVVSSLPVTIVFFLFQGQLVKGLAEGALKG